MSLNDVFGVPSMPKSGVFGVPMVEAEKADIYSGLRLMECRTSAEVQEKIDFIVDLLLIAQARKLQLREEEKKTTNPNDPYQTEKLYTYEPK